MSPALSPGPGIGYNAHMNDAATKPVILVIEDDPTVQEMYAQAFGQAGFTVHQAFDGVQALDMAQAYPDINVMLVDIMLPRLSGYEVIRKVRHMSLTRDIPIIVVTALAGDSDLKHGPAKGANEYVQKGTKPLKEIVELAKRYAAT